VRSFLTPIGSSTEALGPAEFSSLNRSALTLSSFKPDPPEDPLGFEPRSFDFEFDEKTSISSMLLVSSSMISSQGSYGDP